MYTLASVLRSAVVSWPNLFILAKSDRSGLKSSSRKIFSGLMSPCMRGGAFSCMQRIAFAVLQSWNLLGSYNREPLVRYARYLGRATLACVVAHIGSHLSGNASTQCIDNPRSRLYRGRGECLDDLDQPTNRYPFDVSSTMKGKLVPWKLPRPTNLSKFPCPSTERLVRYSLQNQASSVFMGGFQEP